MMFETSDRIFCRRHFIRNARLILSFATIATLLPTPAQGIMYNRDIGDLKSRELAQQPKFDSKAGLSSSGCSAVLIAPDAALSAAHCVGNQVTGKTTVTWKGQKRDGTFWKHESADLIVVKLNEKFEKAVFTPPYTGNQEENQFVWKVGRGGNGILGPDGTPPKYDGKFRAMSNRIEVDRKADIAAVTPTEIRYDFDGPVSAAYTKTGTIYEGGTAPGDSGGPMYMQAGGEWFIIGVTSGPRDNFYADARVSTCLPFIQEKTGLNWKSTPDPKTGG